MGEQTEVHPLQPIKSRLNFEIAQVAYLGASYPYHDQQAFRDQVLEEPTAKPNIAIGQLRCLEIPTEGRMRYVRQVPFYHRFLLEEDLRRLGSRPFRLEG